jgi:hypothetical protein
MTQIPPRQAVQSLNAIFQQWGIPKRIKLDNGWPFVHPCHRDTPTLSILWWIGLGIEVEQNDPGSPQQNGTVEGLQNICYRWVNPTQYTSTETLQEALDQTGHIQRNIFKMPAKGYATRLEMYPELMNNPRKEALAVQFEFSKVAHYLAQQVWSRNINAQGIVKFWGQSIYVDYKRKHQQATITYDPLDHIWLIKNTRGQLIKMFDKQIITAEAICHHAGMSKN